MRAVRFLPVAMSIGWFLVPASARADGASGLRLGLFAHGGYGTYAMGDINDVIGSVNERFRDDDLPISLDEISGGVNLGVGLRCALTPTLSVSAGFERLSGGTDLGIPGVTYQVKIPANALTGTIEFYLPEKVIPTGGFLRLGAGAGMGYYLSAASEEGTAFEETTTKDYKGRGFGFHGMLLGDLAVSTPVHLDMAVGYRHAKTSDVEVDGIQVLNPDGSKSQIDWSGLMTRAGFTFYFLPAP